MTKIFGFDQPYTTSQGTLKYTKSLNGFDFDNELIHKLLSASMRKCAFNAEMRICRKIQKMEKNKKKTKKNPICLLRNSGM
jgi:hypothetical protein